VYGWGTDETELGMTMLPRRIMAFHNITVSLIAAGGSHCLVVSRMDIVATPKRERERVRACMSFCVAETTELDLEQ
jgi:hypothetical protein